MLGAERLFVDRQRALVERSRTRKVALLLAQAGAFMHDRRRVEIGPLRLFVGRHCALVERPRNVASYCKCMDWVARKQPRLFDQAGEVLWPTELRRRIGMVGAEGLLLTCRQRALVEPPRSRKVPLLLEQAAEFA